MSLACHFIQASMAKDRAVVPKPRQGKGRQQANKKGMQHDELPSDDEITEFHRSKDKLSLDPAEDSASEDDASGEDADLDNAVYNLSDPDSNEEEDSGDEQEDARLAERKPYSPACSCLSSRLASLQPAV